MKRLLLAFFFLGGLAAAQTQPVQIAPDCGPMSFNLLTAGNNGPTIDNRFTRCVDWQVTYYTDGFSAMSLVVQSAPDNNGVAGAFVTFVGTVSTGTNPTTTIACGTTNTCNIRLAGYVPFIRVHLTSQTTTGFVFGILHGCAAPGCSSSSTATITGNVNVVGPDAPGGPSTTNPVQIAANDGTNVQRVLSDTQGHLAEVQNVVSSSPAVKTTVPGCINQRSFTFASGFVVLVPISGSTRIYVCHVSGSPSATTNIKFTMGTQTTTPCDTGAVDLTGVYDNVAAFAFDFGPWAPLSTTAGAQQLCINSSASVTGGGVVIFAQF